jgi:nickel-dependent lactate racemase
VGSPPLRTVARGKRTAAILVSDATRAVPTGDVVPYLMEELNAGGIAPDDVTFVVATGVHRPATEEEMRRILGEEWRGRVRIENHDPYRDDALVFLGTTTFGTPVSVNRKVAAADLRIAVGKVEPHEFAGFSGGRKSVLPGISSETTIRANHRPEMILDPKATIGVYGDNPVSLDMVEAARLLGVHFCVNVLVTGDGRIADVVCGDIVESHGRAVAALVERIAVPVRSCLPIVVTTPGHPLNINLYQSIKCIIATAPIVEDRGVIVAYSRCPEGVGSTDMLRPYESARTPEDVVDFLLRNYEIQMDHTLLLSKILKRGIRVVLVSPGVERTTVELMGLIFAESLGEGIGIASGLTGDGRPISFFPCPQRCLPVARGKKT